MPWEVNQSQLPELLIIRYEGRITFADITEATHYAIEQIDHTSPQKILHELINIEAAASSFELVGIPNIWEDAQLNRNNRLALVNLSPKLDKDLLDFFVISSQSMGWRVQSFTDRERAMQWLFPSE